MLELSARGERMTAKLDGVKERMRAVAPHDAARAGFPILLPTTNTCR
jgi:hypothetical protein